MKKLLFVLAFTFIGQQVFSQLYIVSVLSIDSDPTNTCTYSGYDLAIYVVDPTGVETVTCIDDDVDEYGLKTLAQVLNNIIAQGYKITNIQTGAREGEGALTFLQTKSYDPTFGGVPTEELLPGTTFFLSVPWTSNGLEEVPTTLKSLSITPNPANTFVNISLDYSLKGKSEVVFISEAGYIYHKQSIGNISKNEKYNIDISKIPAGKYLITIVNGTTYTLPQKLIVF